MLLYDAPLSGNCYKIRLLLAQLGRPYERVEIDVLDRSNRKQQLGDKNPGLRVPVLQLDDGRCLAESNAILWYLAEGTEYLPDDRLLRHEVLQWMFFEQNQTEPNIGVARYWLTITRNADRYVEPLALRQRLGRAGLQVMEDYIATRRFFVDERYTIADIALFAYADLAEEAGIPLEPFPGVRGWLARLREQPGYVPMLPGA